MEHIPFNRPYFTGNEIETMIKAGMAGQLSGNGLYTRKCHRILERKFGFRKAFLTTSCTDALEMAAILLDIKPGDEVILPSYTFVSTANAFVLRGAKIVFADSSPENPNIDVGSLESLITPRTRVIVVVHYAGIACDMDAVMDLAARYGLYVVEDAAHAIDSYYRDRALGGIGTLGTFSYHETKNIMSGEGGALIVNDPSFVSRAEVIWEKGTNRAAFKRGETDKYEWVDIGSSFLPSEIIAAILHAQLSAITGIQKKRIKIWKTYHDAFSSLGSKGCVGLPVLPDYASINGHMYYILTRDLEERDRMLKYLNKNGIHAVFHYLSLHNSPYYRDKHDGRELPNADRYTDTLIRLPFFFELTGEQIAYIAEKVTSFYIKNDC